jgi:hypothetical protein
MSAFHLLLLWAGGGSADTLAASVSATATASLGLTTAITPAASVSATATASASLTTGVRLAASVTASAMASASLTARNLIVRVGGIDRSDYVRRGTLRVTQRVNNRDTLTITFKDPLSTVAAYRPLNRETISVTYYGTKLFEGEIVSTADSPILDPDRGTLTAVEAVGYSELADRVQVNVPYSRGEFLTSIAEDMVSTQLLPAFGVVAGFSGSTGPVLEFDAAFRVKYVSEVLDQLCAFALAQGFFYLWRIDPTKVLNFFEVGDSIGPTALTDSNATVKRVRSSIRSKSFHNVTWIVGGGESLCAQNERVMGNGVTRFFPVTGTPVDSPMTCQVSLAGGAPTTEPVNTYTGTATDHPYTWDASNKRIIQRSDQTIIASTGYVQIPYNEQGPIAIVRTKEPSFSVDGPRAHPLIEAPEVTDRGQLAALADAALSKSSEEPQRAEIVTRVRGWAPGMVQSVSFPHRGVVGDILIEELEIADNPVISENVANFLTWTLKTIVGSSVYQGSWIDYWREQRGGTGAGGGSIAVGGASGTTATITGASLLFMNMGGSMTEAVSHASTTRHAIPNQCPFSVAGTRVNGTILLRGKVRVSNTATRARLVLRNETDGTDAAVTPWSTTGIATEQYLSVEVARGSAGFDDPEHVYKVELDVDTAGVDNLYWCHYATLENR